jgi:hypothetical protein
MDFDKMKALMEASREKSAELRKPELKEFPKPDSGPTGYIWVTAQQRNGSQPRKGSSHENANDISVVPDFAPTLSIYDVPRVAVRALAGALASSRSARLGVVVGEIGVHRQQYR